jgi:acid ceramidase
LFIGKGVIITRARNESVDIKPLGKDNLWFLIETNYDNWKKQPIYDDRLTPCIKCMQAKGRNEVSFETLFNVLSSRPMLNKVNFFFFILAIIFMFLANGTYVINGTSNRSI